MSVKAIIVTNNKIRLKATRHELDAMISYLVQAEAWMQCWDADMEIRFSRIMAGALLYRLQISLYNKVSAADRTKNKTFQLTLPMEDAAAFMLYFDAVPISNKYNKIMVETFAAKIDSQL